MKRRLVSLLLIVLVFCSVVCSCKTVDHSFSIQFIDVGQGDSALVECDGHYMLIDGGDISAGDTIYDLLNSKGIQKLDYLIVSHLHEDHYGGLIKALTALKGKNPIGKTFSNANYSDKKSFQSFSEELNRCGSSITIPPVSPNKGEPYKFKLGSADVEVIDATSAEENDSLVLMITYGKTRFLFTGDIEFAGQKRLVEKYANGSDSQYKIDVLKMPHHGSWGAINANNNDLYRLISTFTPDYVIISVGTGNKYGHPHKETLDLLDQARDKGAIREVFRTDKNGDIVVKSDGQKVTVIPEQ